MACADHLALDVLAGNPGSSCVHRCTLSHSDVTQAPMSMAYSSEFLAVNQTIKYLQIQAKLEMVYECHAELLARHQNIPGNRNIKKLFTGALLKRFYETIATVYGRVCLISEMRNCHAFSIDTHNIGVYSGKHSSCIPSIL